MEERLIVVDGYGLVFRAYHSMPALSRDDGVPVGAVYGFISMMLRLLSEIKSTHIVMVFDAGGKNFRHRLYPEYKAHRPPVPEDLIPQFPLMREAASALNIHVLEQRGFEADDIIATLAQRALANKEEVLIVSGDKDLMQLVNGHIKMYDAVKSRIIGAEQVFEKFGVNPEKMHDLLAMVGDNADNIPGIPGIGPKTAALLLEEYGTLENILLNTANIKQTKRRETIENSRDIVHLSKQLVALDKNVQLDVTLDDLKARPIDPVKLLAFLEEQNFRSLVARVKKDYKIKTEELSSKVVAKRASTKIITSQGEFAELEEIIKKAGKVALYLQNNFKTNLDIKTSKDIAGFALSIDDSGLFYIPVAQEETLTLFSDEEKYLSFDQVIDGLRLVLESQSVLKIVYNQKKWLHLLASNGCALESVEDVMVIAYCLGSAKTGNGFTELAEHYLGEKDSLHDSGGITKARAAINELDIYSVANYVSKKAVWLNSICNTVKNQLQDERMVSLYEKVDRPLPTIVYKMEREGIKLDKKVIEELSGEFAFKIGELEKEIYKLAGCQFNIASPKQLGEILFDKLAIDPGKKLKSGGYSTGVEVLEVLQQQGHPIADFLIEWRRFHKLKSTYTDSLLNQIDPLTGRIHTNFETTTTSTARFSSSEPNLQNIPIRSEWGNKIRAAFIAKDDYKLVSLDYSQIELRLLAHIADIETLKTAFAEGKDIHTSTASEIFNLPPEQIDADTRRRAKAINFGIIYGISAFGLAKNLGISRGEAGDYIKLYFEKYPGIRSYMEQTKEFARTHGFVKTIMGRKCFTPNINSSNVNLKAFAERAAINAPLQGSAADIIRKAMVQINNVLTESNLDAKMLLQVHDELIFEVKESDVASLIVLAKNTMEHVHDLAVPLVVSAFSGSNWVHK